MSEAGDDKEPGVAERPGFFSELKRRKVFTFAAAYLLSAWFIIEVASVILPAFGAAEFVLRYLIIAAIAFAPIGISLSWYFDVSRKGLVRTESSSVEQVATDEESQGAAPAEAAEGIAERRLITVLQVAISPTSGDAAHAEAYRDYLSRLQDQFGAIVKNYDGYLAHAESEIVTAYFGVYTLAEAASLRALTAAREFMSVTESNNRRNPDLGVAVSVGVDSGFAIIETGLDDASDHLISNFGQTLKSVSMLQLSCPANEIRISQRVFDLVRNRVEGEPAGSISLPGIDHPTTIYRIDTQHQPQLQKARYQIVGRSNELSLIEQGLQNADAGNGQVVILRGDAGIGKSRLVNAAFDLSRQMNANTLVLSCSAFHTHSTLYPLIRYIRELINPDGNLDEAEQYQVLERRLSEYDFSLPELLPIFAQYLSLASPGQESVEPELQKRRFLEALHTIIFANASGQTTLLLIEDLHWADPTFMDLLALLIPSIAGSNILALLTCRPNFKATWTDAGHVSILNINPLNRAQALELIRHIDRDCVLDDARIERIIEKSEGVPLYLEEYTRLLLENVDDGATVETLALPDTLQESLASRFDHSGVTKTILNLGATIGREFPLALLMKTAPALTVGELENCISDLVDRDVIFRRGIGERSTLVFKHILIQEAIYESMLPSQRESNHLAVAEALEASQSETAEHQSEVLARHYEAAGNEVAYARKAIDYWVEAAQLAMHRKAIVEASHFLDNALHLIDRLGQTEEREATELGIQTQRFPVLVALKGYSSASMAAASERALELCERVSGFESRFGALFGVCIVYMVAGQHAESRRVAERIAGLAADQDSAYRVEARMLLGLTRFFLGDLQAATHELEASLDLYDIKAHADHGYLYGQDPSVIALSYLVWIDFSLGNTDSLDTRLAQLAARAEELNHPNSMGFALAFTAWERVFSQHYEDLPALLADLEALSEKYGLVSFQIQGRILGGLLESRHGEHQSGLEHVRRGLIDWEDIGSRCYLPLWYCYYASACADAGDPDAAARALDCAEEMLAEMGEAWAESEILNRRAELAARSGDLASARNLCERAVNQCLTRGAVGWGTYGAIRYLDYSGEGGKEFARASLARLLQASPGTSFERLNPNTKKLEI